MNKADRGRGSRPGLTPREREQSSLDAAPKFAQRSSFLKELAFWPGATVWDAAGFDESAGVWPCVVPRGTCRSADNA